MKTLSLVIPVYNEEKTLRNIVFEVIEKIKSDEINLELVLVDDCSSDKSLEIAKEIANEIPFVKVFHHEKKPRKRGCLKKQGL